MNDATTPADAPPERKSPARAPTLHRAESNAHETALTMGETSPTRKPARTRITVFQNAEHEAAIMAMRESGRLRWPAEKACAAFTQSKTLDNARAAVTTLAAWIAHREKMAAFSAAKKEAQP